ncbi:MAG: amino acid adenylation domain-containing protein [Chitinophagaceae bacterium]|nr:amino acid adenylation domain-containing protein [Chitinophagaceae bacterium]
MSRNIDQGDLIAIYLDRSTDYIVTLLAIMKIGAAYLPLDKSYDEVRISAILKTAKPKCVISRISYNELHACVKINLIDLDDAYENSKQCVSDNILLSQVPDLAQVLFTSGTTGVPKGVKVTHANLINHAFFIKEKIQLTPLDKVLQFACLGFDAFSEELFPALLSGASVVLRPHNLLESFDYLTEVIIENDITLLDLPTSYWNHWVDALVEGGSQVNALNGVRKIILGGESISSKHVSLWQQYYPSVGIINSYGPTETTVICSWYEVPLINNENTKIPIGHPINNTKFYILNKDMVSVEIGEIGELFVGGAGVSKGYLHLPDVSAKVFLRNFADGSGDQYVYRKNDLVYIDPNSMQLHYVGRANDQIKVRGYSVDLGDIKALINTHPLVRQSCVLIHEENADKQIRAYIQTDVGAQKDIIRSDLYKMLPRQVVINELFFVDSWPLNTNGKIDLKALAKLSNNISSNKNQVAISSSQQMILNIWKEVLGNEIDDIDASFFELGGHSLQAISLLTKIKRSTGIKLSVGILFKYPTIRMLAEQIEDKTSKDKAGGLRVLLSNADHIQGKEKLFFFPPIGGSILCYKLLASLLESTYVVYGFHDVEERDGSISIGDAAKKYVEEIKSIQAHGPYYLAGWSMGGVIAQEVACILANNKEPIELLALIEAWHPHALPKSEFNTDDIEYKFIHDFIHSMPRNTLNKFDYSILNLNEFSGTKNYF